MYTVGKDKRQRMRSEQTEEDRFNESHLSKKSHNFMSMSTNIGNKLKKDVFVESINQMHTHDGDGHFLD